ncbi:MAG: hypothetical protein RL150_360 [Candidatus Parcubacteria bacterium]|jgi:molecular chaperone GrpE
MSDTLQTPDDMQEDIVVDADNVSDYDLSDDTSPEDVVRKLKQDLKVCKQERQEYLDGWQRAKADLLNAKKRASDDQITFLERAGSTFVEELLPVLDSFDMAFKNKEAWEQAPEQWRRGVEYIHTQLMNIVTSRGVQVLDPVGKPFSHHEHHSVRTVASSPEQDGIVVSVIRKGYKVQDMVIRPADVEVGSADAS